MAAIINEKGSNHQEDANRFITVRNRNKFPGNGELFRISKILEGEVDDEGKLCGIGLGAIVGAVVGATVGAVVGTAVAPR
jgi:hypothetical protein